MKLRLNLRLAALAVVLATAGYWAFAGAHRGWSQHRVPVSRTEEVTGIVYTVYEDRFVPGVELPGTGLALAVVLATASFFIRTN